jgi:hypothetical protein
MNRWFRIAGYAACHVAILAMLGGHWLVLQSVAWTRMIVAYSAESSLGSAVAKTFDGKHPCKMCLQIREGRQQEEQQQKKASLIKTEKLPDLMLQARESPLPMAPNRAEDAVPVVPRLHSDFVESPPTPPPRAASAAV